MFTAWPFPSLRQLRYSPLGRLMLHELIQLKDATDTAHVLLNRFVLTEETPRVDRVRAGVAVDLWYFLRARASI